MKFQRRCIILWAFLQARKMPIANNERKTNHEYLPTLKKINEECSI